MADQDLLGMEVEWQSDTACVDFDYETGEIETCPVYSKGTIVRATPQFIWILIEEAPKPERIIKEYLLSCIEDMNCEAYKRINESLQKPASLQKSPDDREYYVYKLYENDEALIHYVGITHDIERRYRQHCRCYGTNLDLNIWIQKQLYSGKKPCVGIIETTRGLVNALELETNYIALYLEAGMPLKNILKVGGTR